MATRRFTFGERALSALLAGTLFVLIWSGLYGFGTGLVLTSVWMAEVLDGINLQLRQGVRFPYYGLWVLIVEIAFVVGAVIGWNNPMQAEHAQD